MDGKKIVFDYYLDKDNSVVKDPDPLVFDYAEEAAIEGGAVPFKGSTTLGNQTYKMVGMRYKDRVAAAVVRGGQTVYVFYGVGGKVDDLVKVRDAATSACMVFLAADDIAETMARFLSGADTPKEALDPNVNKT